MILNIPSFPTSGQFSNFFVKILFLSSLFFPSSCKSLFFCLFVLSFLVWFGFLLSEFIFWSSCFPCHDGNMAIALNACCFVFQEVFAKAWRLRLEGGTPVAPGDSWLENAPHLGASLSWSAKFSPLQALGQNLCRVDKARVLIGTSCAAALEVHD